MLYQSPKADHQNELCDTSVALVLSGCGAMDGSEITEAVALMINLREAGIKYSIFAPDQKQHHVINHINGSEVESESRNAMREAARIARGEISPLTELDASDYEALFFAGGFGAAKNLCNFALAGAEATLDRVVAEKIKAFYDSTKPIASLCIAPMLLALYARDNGLQDVNLTLGHSNNEASQIATSFGVKMTSTHNGQAVIDEHHRFVSAPAYMIDSANASQINACAHAVVEGSKRLLKL